MTYFTFNTRPTKLPKPFIMMAWLFVLSFLRKNFDTSMGINRMETKSEESSEKLTVHACSLNNSPAAPCK